MDFIFLKGINVENKEEYMKKLLLLSEYIEGKKMICFQETECCRLLAQLSNYIYEFCEKENYNTLEVSLLKQKINTPVYEVKDHICGKIKELIEKRNEFFIFPMPQDLKNILSQLDLNNSEHEIDSEDEIEDFSKISEISEETRSSNISDIEDRVSSDISDIFEGIKHFEADYVWSAKKNEWEKREESVILGRPENRRDEGEPSKDLLSGIVIKTEQTAEKDLPEDREGEVWKFSRTKKASLSIFFLILISVIYAKREYVKNLFSDFKSYLKNFFFIKATA